jgi:hypothetical protein
MKAVIQHTGPLLFPIRGSDEARAAFSNQRGFIIRERAGAEPYVVPSARPEQFCDLDFSVMTPTQVLRRLGDPYIQLAISASKRVSVSDKRNPQGRIGEYVFDGRHVGVQLPPLSHLGPEHASLCWRAANTAIAFAFSQTMQPTITSIFGSELLEVRRFGTALMKNPRAWCYVTGAKQDEANWLPAFAPEATLWHCIPLFAREIEIRRIRDRMTKEALQRHFHAGAQRASTTIFSAWHYFDAWVEFVASNLRTKPFKETNVNACFRPVYETHALVPTRS